MSPVGTIDPLRLAERAWERRSADPKAACAAAERVLAVADVDPVARARALAAKGNALLRLGGPQAAREVLEQAVEAAEDAGDPLAVARAAVGQGVRFMREARHAQAMHALHDATEAFRLAGDPLGVAGALVNMGVVHKVLGDPAGALRLLQDAQAGFAALGDRHGEAVALSNIVSVYRELGDDAAAVPLAERVCELAATVDEPGFLAFARAGLGAVVAASGDPERGGRLLEEALDQARRSGNVQAETEALGSLALLRRTTDPDGARELLRRAVALARVHGDTWTLVEALLATVETAAEPQDRRALAEQAAELAGARGGTGQAGRAHLAAARACEVLGETEGALEHYRSAARAVELAADERRHRRLAMLEVATALSEARSRAREQRHRIVELARTGRHRADLLAMVAHELRGPLTVATMCLDPLQATVSADGRPMLPRLEQALARIGRLVDAVGDEAAAEHGRLVLEKRSEDLLALVHAIAAEHRAGAARKGQKLVVEGRPVRLAIDASRLFHAIDNLVSNAIKFSPKGATVRLRVTASAERVRLSVLDQGPGVQDDELRRLFDPFVRGSASPTAGEGSTGLGLYITRRMVEAHAGQVGVTARKDGPGACFWIELPR